MADRRRVRNPQGQFGTIDPSIGVSSFIPDEVHEAPAFARVISAASARPLQKVARAATVNVPDFLKPAALSSMGTAAGMATRVPWAGYAGGVAGQAVGELARTKSRRTRDVAGVVGSGLSTAGALSGGAHLARGARTVAKGFPFLVSGKRQIALAEKGRAALGQVMGEAGETLEKRLGQITGELDLTDEVASLQQSMQGNPALASIVQQGIEKAARVGDMTLVDLLTSPSPQKVVSALQGQQVLATLRMAKPVGQALGRAGRSMANRGGAFLRQTSDEALDLLSHIKGVQAKAVQTFPQAFPEAVSEFAKKAQGFRELVPKFKKGTLVGNIKRGFGDPEVAQTVRQTLPADVVRELFLPSQATRNLGMAERGAKWITLGVGVKEILERLNR